MKIAEFRHYELHQLEDGRYCFGTIREHQGKDFGIPINQFGTKEELIKRLQNFIQIDIKYGMDNPIIQDFFPTIEMYKHFISALENIK